MQGLTSSLKLPVSDLSILSRPLFSPTSSITGMYSAVPFYPCSFDYIHLLSGMNPLLCSPLFCSPLLNVTSSLRFNVSFDSSQKFSLSSNIYWCLSVLGCTMYYVTVLCCLSCLVWFHMGEASRQWLCLILSSHDWSLLQCGLWPDSAYPTCVHYVFTVDASKVSQLFIPALLCKSKLHNIFSRKF